MISMPNINAASGCQRRSHSQVAAQITSPATPSTLPAKGSPLISAVARPLAARTTSAAGTPAGQGQAGTPFARQTRVASADATAKKVRISMSMRGRSLPKSEAPPPVPIPHQANGSVLFQVFRASMKAVGFPGELVYTSGRTLAALRTPAACLSTREYLGLHEVFS